MKKIYFIIISVITIVACKQVYNAPVNSPVTGYLVAEGFINSATQSITTIQLTRTTKLVDTTNIIYEHSAQVTIEGDGNDMYALNETSDGTYSSALITLNKSEKYRLHIKTSDGKEYLSDPTTVKSTPAIDSVSWQRENSGVKIYINTHDYQNNTKYYQWKYEETWEFHSAYSSSLKYTYDPVTNVITGITYRDPITQSPDEKLYKCWQSMKSTNILLGSTEKLSSDLVYLPLNYIPPADWRISVLYSINVKQYALSKEAYQFLEIMKKNTEQLGSIFDAQPSELKGNIHCITDPREPVIGFIEVSQEQNQRIFIEPSQLTDWNYNSGCPPPIDVENNKDSIQKKAAGLSPAIPDKVFFNTILTFYAAEPYCIDCTLRGTNIKPGFWP